MSIKYRQLYLLKDAKDIGSYDRVVLPDGTKRSLSKEEKNPNLIPNEYKVYSLADLSSKGAAQGSQPFKIKDDVFYPPIGKHWAASYPLGMTNLLNINRIEISGKTLRYVRYFDDFPASELDNNWNDQLSEQNKDYVVQTSIKVIQRCLLMTTDPGDLVLDITCGSGTTAFVAEKWGRRWITCDTSRVAITLAKQRLMTAQYDYYPLKYPDEGIKAGFIYKTVPHVTLKAIANNPEIDAIYDKMHPAIEKALAELNQILDKIPPNPPFSKGGKLVSAVKPPLEKEELAALGKPHLEKEAEKPPFEKGGLGGFKEWQIPFDFPNNWPEAAQQPFAAFQQARQALQKRMDDAIAANADQEVLYDQPLIDKNKLRVTGPFTVEAVPFPTVLSGQGLVDSKLATNHSSLSTTAFRQQQWQDELLKAGIRGKNRQKIELAEIETLSGTQYLHARAITKDEGEEPVVISFGLEHAPLEQRQMEFALRETEKLRPAPKMIVFAAFNFDPEAAKDIDELNWPGVTLLKVQMNTDLLTEDLKKKRASNESFWLMGQPDVSVVSEEWLVISDQSSTYLSLATNHYPLINYELCKKLSGLDSLAKINALERKDLCFYAAIAERRDLWLGVANAPGGDFDSVEHRGRTSQVEHRRIQAISGHRQGFAGGIGNAADFVRAIATCSTKQCRTAIKCLRGNQQIIERTAEIFKAVNSGQGLVNSKLATNHSSLTTYFQVEVFGFDYFDTQKSDIVSGGKNKIAMWLLDTDYDERALLPRQVFLPMAGSKEGWNKLSKNLKATLNEERLTAYHGTVSLPFAAGKNRKVAVKLIDDRGIESLKILPLA